MMIKGVTLQRKQAYNMEEVVHMYIKSMKLASGLNNHRVFHAWNEASGAERFTLKQFYRDRKLFVTVSSSVVRNQLFFQKDAITLKINQILEEDKLFTRDFLEKPYVKEIVLK